MSGGVDSSLAAFLLKEEGYEVIGFWMRFVPCQLKGTGKVSCCGFEEEEDSRNVAQRLEIPFYVLNFKDEFEREVVDYFFREHARGRTPNPCILCNQKIKFGAFLSRAKALEAGWVATGHYVRVEYDKGKKRYLLKKGLDSKKDQSYFLFSLNQKQLSSTLFPLGSYTKEETRKMAKRLGLKVYDKPESQDLCFLSNGDDFERLKEGYRPNPGLIMNTRGEILGRHSGIHRFTLGQRKGLGGGAGKPLYVVTINSEKGDVIVGEEREIYKKGLVATNLNWIAMEELPHPLKAKARIRYNHKESEVLISPLPNGKVWVEFEAPQRAITPGQAVVFYTDDTILGGGWIE